MKNWKIGTRITAGFVTVILIVAALGLYALVELQTIDHRATIITEDSLPSIDLVDGIEERARESMAQVLTHLLLDSKAEMAQLEETLSQSSKLNAAALQKYEGFVSDARDRELFVATQNARKQYVEIRDAVLGLSRDMKTKEAMDLLRSKLTPAYEQYMQASNDLTANVHAEGARAAASARASAIGATLGIEIGLGLAIVSGLFPNLQAAPETLAAADAWLEGHPAAAPALRRLVAEARDDLARALSAQECDAAQ